MLKSVKLPKSMTGVTKYLFYGCKYLKDVSIEKNTSYIGYGAFENCEDWKNSTYIQIRWKSKKMLLLV